LRKRGVIVAKYDSDYRRSVFHTVLQITAQRRLLQSPADARQLVSALRATSHIDGDIAEVGTALRDPAHEQHQELRDWVGGDYDPKAFPIEAVNRIITGLLPRRTTTSSRGRWPGKQIRQFVPQPARCRSLPKHPRLSGVLLSAHELDVPERGRIEARSSAGRHEV